MRWICTQLFEFHETQCPHSLGKERVTYHLDSDVEHCLEVELASALLEEILKGLAEEVHDHDVIHLSVFGLLVTDEVKERHESLTAQLVDKLALPEKHDVSLHLNCFFLYK